MFILCVLFKHIMSKRGNIPNYYTSLKISVLFYLLPLFFLKRIYINIFFPILKKINKAFTDTEYIYVSHNKGIIYYNDKDVYYNKALKTQSIVLIVYLIISLTVITVLIIRYIQFKKSILKLEMNINMDTSDVSEKIEELKHKCNIRPEKKIDLIAVEQRNYAFTIGFIKPVIVYPCTEQEKEKELLFNHELIHIKRMDFIWNILLMCVLCIHWFNPFAWLLYQEFNMACEESCDYEVLKNRNENEKITYAKLLINSTNNSRITNWRQKSFSNKNILKKRIERIVQNQKMLSRIAGGGLIALEILLTSVTVLAYPDIMTFSNNEGYSAEAADIESIIESDGVFYREGTQNPYLSGGNIISDK